MKKRIRIMKAGEGAGYFYLMKRRFSMRKYLGWWAYHCCGSHVIYYKTKDEAREAANKMLNPEPIIPDVCVEVVFEST
jgi:hypothetical protein